MADTDDPIRVYIELHKAVAHRAARLRELSAMLDSAAKGLVDYPRYVRFSDEPWPPGGSTGSRPPIGARADWPSPEGLRQALSEWHDAHALVTAAWARLTPDDQAILKDRMPGTAVPQRR